MDGLKTGYTDAAGYCLVSSAEREGMRLIAVVMGMGSPESRADGSYALLNYGFRFFETFELYGEGDPWRNCPRQGRDLLDERRVPTRLLVEQIRAAHEQADLRATGRHDSAVEVGANLS